MKRKGKKILITIVSLLLVVSLGLGGWYYMVNREVAPVKVFPFMYLGMTEYWGDSQESYGPITTDRIQTVYLSDTQTVTEILVFQGAEVKKGDLLMTFDTTLTDLALERERLGVEKLKLQLEDAKDRLKEINNMRPMVIPSFDPEEEEEENLGVALVGEYQLSQQSKFDGSKPELAIVCWLRGDKTIDDALLEVIRQLAVEYQTENAGKEPEPTESTGSAASPVHRSEPEVTDPVVTEPPVTEPPATEPPATEPPVTEPEVTEPEVTEPEVTEPEVTEPEVTEPEVTEPEVTEPEVTEPEVTEPEVTEPEVTEPEVTEPETTDPEETEPEETEPEEVEVGEYYVIFKVTEGNMSLGMTETWQGLHVTCMEDGTFRFRFFNAHSVPDHTLPPEEEKDDIPQIDFGSGYTANQIAQMRAEQEKAIRQLEFDIKMAQAEYKIKQTEASTGGVYAQIDGTVVSALTEEEARMTGQPVLKVSGGGGFYVEGSVSELEKENLQIGQEVTVNDWNTGMVYTGTIESIGDFPTDQNGYMGMGNPNVSYYPFRVFVDGSADLQAGFYVSVMYSSASAQQGIYLENPFLRTEQGRSYVYVRGEDGLLEKRYVTTGKSLWGSYTEILSGITEEDLLAFPYGKHLKEGAPTLESEISELYE